MHNLEIDALIWDRDSHGLFDYDSKVLKESKLQMMGSAQIVRDGLSLKTVIPNLDDQYKDFQKLLSLVYRNGRYWVYHQRTLYDEKGEFDNDFTHFKQVWQVVRFQNQVAPKMRTIAEHQNRRWQQKIHENCVKMVQGDVMKFGRVRFRVKKLVVEGG